MPAVVGYTVRSDYILRFLRGLGVESTVVTSAQHPNGETLHEVIGGVSHFRTPAIQRRLPLGVRELTLMARLERRVAAAIREVSPALVHACSPMLVGIPAIRAARRAGLPVVYELRDLWENPSVDRGKLTEGSPLYRAAQAFENHALRHADVLVAICRTLKDAIVPRAGRTPVFVVDNGVDLEKFTARPRRPDLVEKYGLVGKRVIAYLGTFQPYEGVELLVRAMPQIAAKVPDAHLLVVGGGGEQPKLVDLAWSLGLDGRVTFTGRVPHDEVVDVFPLAELLVYPRLFTRTTALTTPLKPLEAMSMGRPVLVSDIPPMRELVARSGETGLLFAPGDKDDLARAITSALADPAALARVGEGGRAYVHQARAWPTLVARYADVYAAAIEQNRRRTGAELR
jgi:PEP-CTERM/exosortase A-associated glycosyltransferase